MTRTPKAIRKAVEYIEANFGEPLTLDEAAAAAAMSRYHFSRCFRRHTGLTFKGYINRLRIAEAKRLMQAEGLNVSEAAFRVGYNDLSYFSRVFKKEEGIIPSTYCKTLPNEGSDVFGQKSSSLQQ
jgi:two-component system response regulator YesN